MRLRKVVEVLRSAGLCVPMHVFPPHRCAAGMKILGCGEGREARQLGLWEK